MVKICDKCLSVMGCDMFSQCSECDLSKDMCLKLLILFNDEQRYLCPICETLGERKIYEPYLGQKQIC